MDEARRRADGGGTFAVIADHQLQGRGRRRRVWHDRPGSALLATVVLPDGPIARDEVLALRVGLWVIEAAAAIGARGLRLKWPNDVLHRDRKVCGILIERTAGAAYIGIGCNVTAAPHPGSAALSDCAGIELYPEQLWNALSTRIESAQPHEAWHDHANRVLAWRGCRVRIVQASSATDGTLLGVAPSGGVVLQTASGPVEFAVGTLQRCADARFRGFRPT